ncbi:MAG: ATP-binding protein [Eubacteriales bacterium]|nr:ATP-binding protein [Eubacteriales bacterium]
MLFIGGIHGVGKTTFCRDVWIRFGYKTYSASDLIASKKGKSFAKDKLIPDISDNQAILVSAVDDISASGYFLLDGHFTLLNSSGKICCIPEDTFIKLKPNGILVLTEQPRIIISRLRRRDNIHYTKEIIKTFQEAEVSHAREIAQKLNVPILIASKSDDMESIFGFIKQRAEV